MQSTADRRRDFERRVERAEHQLQASPQRYLLRVALMAGLGYGVIWGLIGLSLLLFLACVVLMFVAPAFIGFLLASKIIFLLPILAWVLFRALSVPFDRPSGALVTARQAPVLFEELDRLSRHLKLPRLHEVILTPEFNAGIMQIPRLGVLGWPRNVLMLGMPMLLALSPDQMRAILAHEAGHLARNHARFGNWIYRVRMSWYRVMTGFDRMEGWAISVFRKFFDWYTPAFDALSFPLARQNEFEADAVGADYASPQALAEALVATEVLADWSSSDYWQPLIDRASRESEPEAHAFSKLEAFFHEERPEQARVDTIVERQMRLPTDYADTHPSLSDRLAAVRHRPRFAGRQGDSAAVGWLGDFLPPALDILDRLWVEENAVPWQESFERAEAARKELERLGATMSDDPKLSELLKKAQLTEVAVAPEAALALYEQVLARAPDQPVANLALGRLLVDADATRAIDHLGRVSEHAIYGFDACLTLQDLYRREGQNAEVAVWQDKTDQAYDRFQQAQFERTVLLESDTLQAPRGLGRDQLDDIADQLKAIGGIKHAFIAEKWVSSAPDVPVYVISITPRGLLPKPNSWAEQVVAEMNVDLDFLLIPRMGQLKSQARRIEREGLRLF
ncbi:M48 family metalloprotease [Wenzhouxiangella marina]|uniref:Uncharacterized protein n=1 Tax=Wenzhouxiangella marina TaxID=1579979 RepID=A0A0K0XZE5_9GAMM|nr:M48 family metalloprotease [Wenzhouxiangella marina]AKS43007.1 hypothetical protein WM2015_2649 [Wenzhouxiangella marina]MBB6087310.1 Zn-dependent protease with chaperone function [Wenzhouxiangella marina]